MSMDEFILQVSRLGYHLQSTDEKYIHRIHNEDGNTIIYFSTRSMHKVKHHGGHWNELPSEHKLKLMEWISLLDR